MTLFIIIYLMLLASYLYTRINSAKNIRAINKYLMATMYLVLAWLTFLKRQDFSLMPVLLIAAISLAWLGDIFLVYKFRTGGVFFMLGNICFSAFICLNLTANGFTLSNFIYSFIAAAALIALFIFACGKWPKTFRLGKMRWLMTLYLSTIITHGMLGAAMIILLPDIRWTVMGTGSLLFMISDILLTAYRYVFDNNKWLIRANSITYFTGILLIVLSMSVLA